jgi:hypothetical protein
VLIQTWPLVADEHARARSRAVLVDGELADEPAAVHGVLDVFDAHTGSL